MRSSLIGDESAVTGSAGQVPPSTPLPEEENRTRDDLREALTVRLWRRFPISKWQAEAHADALIADLFAPILAQISALLSENAALRAERDKFSRELTGLTSGGSEFFTRRGEDFIADADACVSHIRERRQKAHEHRMAALREARDALARLSALQDRAERAGKDTARLDFLDGCNARLNASYGTQYGWRLVLNHNVNRLMLADMKVDLHDSEGGNDKLPSCRLAIDAEMNRLRAARKSLTPESQEKAGA